MQGHMHVHTASKDYWLELKFSIGEDGKSVY